MPEQNYHNKKRAECPALATPARLLTPDSDKINLLPEIRLTRRIPNRREHPFHL